MLLYLNYILFISQDIKVKKNSYINVHCMKYIKSFVTKVQQYIIHNFYIHYFHLKNKKKGFIMDCMNMLNVGNIF